MTARRVLLDGLARDADSFVLVSELAPLTRDLGVFADQGAEAVPAQNAHTALFGGWMGAPCGRVLLQRPVLPMAVAMIGVLAQNQP